MGRIKIGKFPGTAKEIEINQPRTLLEVLAVAEFTHEGSELRVNGTPAEIQQQVKPGDTVLLVKNLKGA